MTISQRYGALMQRFRRIKSQVRIALIRFMLSTREIPSALNDSAWVLYGLVKSLHPDVCVEIGSAAGSSACHIALALRENWNGILYAIDPHTETPWNDELPAGTFPMMQENLRACDLAQWVKIIRSNSLDAARSWSLPIDLIFIDGDHSYEGVKSDWELFSPHLRKHGIAIFHDTTWDLHRDDPIYRPDIGVPRFIEELRKAGYPIVTIDRNYGLSIVQNCPGGIPLGAS